MLAIVDDHTLGRPSVSSSASARSSSTTATSPPASSTPQEASEMTSHREAPEIAKDPVADSTDTYAFMHPTEAGQVVIIANFIPLQQPNGGPNFYEFADDVLYEINVSNTNKCEANISYQFRFKTTIRNPNTFLYNTGPIDTSQRQLQPPADLQRRAVKNGKAEPHRRQPAGAAVQRRPAQHAQLRRPRRRRPPRRSVAASSSPASAATRSRSTWAASSTWARCVRSTRPHLSAMAAMDGINSVQSYNVHTIAIQVPASDLTGNGGRRPASSTVATSSVSGPRQPSLGRVFNQGPASTAARAPPSRSRAWATRCSTRSSCRWPRRTSGTPGAPRRLRYAKYVNKPELAGLLPSSTRTCSRTWRPTRSRGPTSTRSC